MEIWIYFNYEAILFELKKETMSILHDVANKTLYDASFTITALPPFVSHIKNSTQPFNRTLS